MPTIELDDLERLAWEGSLREQTETLEVANELAAAASRLFRDLPRASTWCLDAAGEARRDVNAKAYALASAIAVRRGLAVPTVAPAFDGKTLTWLDAASKSESPASA